MKRYSVNLNENAETRWNHVLNDNKENLSKAMIKLNELIPKGIIFKLIEWLLALCTYLRIVYYSDEIRAISRHTKIPLGKLVMLQLYYELNAHCTSIITQSNKGMCLTRTMDWDLELLKNLTIIVDFKFNNQYIFTATTWVGYVGVFTGMKPFKYAVSLNYRLVNNPIYINILNILFYGWPTGFLIRDVLTNQNSFRSAVLVLAKEKLISPCYFTIVGNDDNDGCILIRNHNNLFKAIDINKNGKYLVQTNHDDGDDKSENIIYSRERLIQVHEIMKNEENILEPGILMNNMKGYPLINEETIYTTQMIPKISYIHSKINI